MAEQSSHLHRCQGCGTIWGHGNMMQGDVEAHTCPKCGKQNQWRVYSGGKSHAVQPRRGEESTVSLWSYLRAVAPIVLLSAALAFLLSAGLDWLAGKVEDHPL